MENEISKTEVGVKNAMDSLKKNVEEILTKEITAKERAEKLMSMMNDFFYLQQLHKNYKEIPEYEEAKKLIETISRKDPEFVDMFFKLVNEK